MKLSLYAVAILSILNAVGCAEAIKKMRDHEDMRDAVGGEFDPQEVVVCTGGDGSTSEGEFWEALSSACVLQVPVVHQRLVPPRAK